MSGCCDQVSDLAYLLRAMKKEVRNLQDAKLKKKARHALAEGGSMVEAAS